MHKTIAFVTLFSFIASASAQQPPATAPDPKMPPMPSMEAPDSNDMTKPAGASKPKNTSKRSASESTPAKTSKSAASPAGAPKVQARHALGKRPQDKKLVQTRMSIGPGKARGAKKNSRPAAKAKPGRSKAKTKRR